ncbi:outer membrane beta-barrel protein, partial [endosymbiont of Ridgeia piscesae]
MRKNKIFTRKQLAVLCGFSALFAENALGLNWDVNPALSVRGSYTDNIALTPSDQAESDFIVEVIPELAVSGLGRALSLDLNYRAQLLKYMDHSDSDTVRHQLLADGTAMLVEDLFYIDARG